MRHLIESAKAAYRSNKYLTLILVIVAVAIVVYGCSAQGAPPSGPIGGGCG
jgi:hypothetical protein